MFPRCGENPSWRDQRDLSKSLPRPTSTLRRGADCSDSWVLRTMLPGVAIEDQMTWHDYAHSDVAYIFDQVVIVDRCTCRR